MLSCIRRVVALFLALILLAGCGATHWNLLPWKKKKPPRAIAKFSQLVGTVVLVSEEPSFVLIDNGSLPPPAPGTPLAINYQTSGRVELKVTAIRKPPYVVADIVKGTPRKGDAVYQ